jgi:hypothetical protein
MIDPELMVPHSGRRAHQVGWPRLIFMSLAKSFFCERLQPIIHQRMGGDSLISDLGFIG